LVSGLLAALDAQQNFEPFRLAKACDWPLNGQLASVNLVLATARYYMLAVEARFS